MTLTYLIPYYNAYDELCLSLASLHENTDVTIVDDGSDIPLSTLLNKDAYPFHIHIITAPSNLGIEGALNLGLDAIYNKYQLVARLDCGDISASHRILSQLAYFARDPEYVLVGSWARFVDSHYTYLFTSKVPSNSKAIERNMFLNNMFIHPSVMMKLSMVQKIGGYPTDRKAAEDYALFYKLQSCGKCANIPEALIDYVLSPNSISSQQRTRQIVSRIRVMQDHWTWNWRCQYGILRAIALLLVPRNITMWLRKHIALYR
jgi:glycosyltransferase involved in cell wall biosynthesis